MGPVQGADDLLVFFLDRHKAPVGSGDGFAEGGGIRCIIFAALAALAVEVNALGGDEPDGVAVLPEQSRPVGVPEQALPIRPSGSCTINGNHWSRDTWRPGV